MLTKNIHVQTLLKILSGLKSGHLSLTLPNGETMEFGNRTYPMQADIQIHDWSVFKEVMSHGDIGFAESYIRGLWNTSDLRAILELAILNRTNLESYIRQPAWLNRLSPKALAA
jgi:cyclopropane-fatty-acyl-phospholipid synthase